MTQHYRTQLLLLLMAGLALGATFTEPTLELERPTYRYVFVFDITGSMNVQDVGTTTQPMSRLEYAKQMTLQTLKRMPCGTEAGLALFTGHRAFLMITPVEICANYRELSVVLSNIDWRMTWEARSEVAKGLFKSLELLTSVAGAPRLVFVTDGHEAPPLNPDVPPQFRGEVGAVNGVIVGVGGAKLVPIPKFDKTGAPAGFWQADEVMHIDTFNAERIERDGGAPITSGTEHLSSLRETYLENLAADTALGYHHLVGTGAFEEELKSAELALPKVVTTDIRAWFGLLALGAFVASLLVGSRDKLRLANRSPDRR